MIGSDFGMRVNKPAETVEKKNKVSVGFPEPFTEKTCRIRHVNKANSRIFAGGDLTVAGIRPSTFKAMTHPWDCYIYLHLQ